MTDPRPMDGFLDIYPWPYEWHRDINENVISALAVLEFWNDSMDVWTYSHHWSLFGDHGTSKDEWITDIYFSADEEKRMQLPPSLGDSLAEAIIQDLGDKILALFWNHWYWRPALNWQQWTGPQGDFVDHIHIEWKEYVWEDD